MNDNNNNNKKQSPSKTGIEGFGRDKCVGDSLKVDLFGTVRRHKFLYTEEDYLFGSKNLLSSILTELKISTMIDRDKIDFNSFEENFKLIYRPRNNYFNSELLAVTGVMGLGNNLKENYIITTSRYDHDIEELVRDKHDTRITREEYKLTMDKIMHIIRMLKLELRYQKGIFNKARESTNDMKTKVYNNKESYISTDDMKKISEQVYILLDDVGMFLGSLDYDLILTVDLVKNTLANMYELRDILRGHYMNEVPLEKFRDIAKVFENYSVISDICRESLDRFRDRGTLKLLHILGLEDYIELKEDEGHIVKASIKDTDDIPKELAYEAVYENLYEVCNKYI